jgi:transcription termination/antitermination protein NusG
MADLSKQFKWYCLRVVSNKERKIKERIDIETVRERWVEKGYLNRILLPIKVQRKVRNQKMVKHEQILIPGYIFIEADAHAWKHDEVLSKINDIKDVIHFLGDKEGNPTPMREEEIRNILRMIDDSEEELLEFADPFIVGEDVKITDGPFENFEGVVKEVHDEKKKLKVITKVFGRDTEVELSFVQVEKKS